MNAKEIAILAALAIAGLIAGLWLRGYSDGKTWTSQQ